MESKEDKKQEKKEETKEEQKQEQKEEENEEQKEEKNAAPTTICEIPLRPSNFDNLGIKNMVEDSFLYTSVKTWDELGVKPEIKKGLLEMDFITPSKIQSISFPLIMKEPRLHLVAQAKNGTGKTGAFGLGVLSSIDENSNDTQAVIFAHTRELVHQIYEVLVKMAKYTKIKITTFSKIDAEPNDYGHILVITPGHFENRFLKRDKKTISNLKIMVLDEADYMLRNEVTSRIVDRTFTFFKKEKKDVQILFFSATYDTDCFTFIKKFYDKANLIELKKEELTLKNVTQMYQECKTPEDKVSFIEEYLKVQGSERVIIFANKRDYVTDLQDNLQKRGYKAFILMGGDMALSNRDETIKKFSNGEIQILISTDLLSRGYDERAVKLVINFDLPIKYGRFGNIEPDYETYLHRIGRTGRFGTRGIGLNLCCGKNDMDILKKIEKYYKTKMEKMKSLDELLEDLKKFYLEDS